jgi:hypothetical protein
MHDTLYTIKSLYLGLLTCAFTLQVTIRSQDPNTLIICMHMHMISCASHLFALTVPGSAHLRFPLHFKSLSRSAHSFTSIASRSTRACLTALHTHRGKAREIACEISLIDIDKFKCGIRIASSGKLKINYAEINTVSKTILS